MDKCIGQLDRDHFCRSLELVLKASGIAHNVVDDVRLLDSVGYSEVVDKNDLLDRSLLDAITKIEKDVVIDTNIVYNGIHTQMYEAKNTIHKINIPNCLLAEMYIHQVEGKVGFERLRGEISNILVKELKESFNPRILYPVTTLPCEVGVGMHLAGRTDYIFVTADSNAFKKISSEFNIPSIKTKLVSISDVVFYRDQDMRKISYAYYALAQLKALVDLLNRSIGLEKTVNIGINILFN
jgi:hypothetical protein